MINKKIIVVVLIVIILTISLAFLSWYLSKESRLKKYYSKINSGKERDSLNINTLPLIENDKKYIELQTLDWIKKRKEKGYCYGLLEKDKVVMAKWIEKFNIRVPKIHYYNYHDKFKYQDLYKIIVKNPDKKFIIKITHLQSNYGIIIVPALNTQKNDSYLSDVYDKCLQKFKTCFVCNHDKGTAPKISEIKKGRKESHYKLYETIEPGIIIQDFFYSKKNKNSAPRELKILVYGDKIIYGVEDRDFERYKLVYQMAKNVSKLLGSSLIRVDIFIKEDDNPYIPYLNEISLSPANGFRTKYFNEEYKKEIKNYKAVDMEIDSLIRSSPMRSIPIEKYLSDNDWGTFYKDKYRF